MFIMAKTENALAYLDDKQPKDLKVTVDFRVNANDYVFFVNLYLRNFRWLRFLRHHHRSIPVHNYRHPLQNNRSNCLMNIQK